MTIREEHDVGTIFNASVKVCQKTYESSGKPKGKPYLLAEKKTIIVTGGLGFIGSNLIKKLEIIYRIIIIDNKSSNKKEY